VAATESGIARNAHQDRTFYPGVLINDKSRQVASGGPITKDNTTAEYYCTIFTAAESAIEKNLLWTGSDDGLIYVSRDAGKNWENVTPPAAGKWTMWNCVETDPFKKGCAYFVGARYKLDDYTPYIFKTEDYGKTWQLITNGIDKMHFARVIRADRKRPGLLYAGTEYGMYISYDYGASWKRFQLNLPIVPITDLTIKNNDLVVATQGRAFWVLDGLGVVQGNKDECLGKQLCVLPVDTAYRMDGYVDSNIRNGGMNSPNGVVFNYYLNNTTDTSDVAVTIFDREYKKIKSFSKNGKEKEDKLDFSTGMNELVYNMQYGPVEKIEGMVLWNGYPGDLKIPPGPYTARFRYGNDSVDVPFVIKGDPNYKIAEAVYQEQVEFCLSIRDKFNQIQKAVKNIRSIRGQINDLIAKTDTNKSKDLKALADTINKRMTTVEEALYQTKAKAGEDILNFPMRLNDRMSAIYNVASSGNNAPTKQVRDAFAAVSAETDIQLGKLKEIMDNDVKAFNKMIFDERIPVVGVKE
jgi:hypothetical protein